MLSKLTCRWMVAGGVLAGLLAMAAAQDDAAFQQWLVQDQAAFAQYNAEVTAAYQRFYEEEQKAFQEFLRQAGDRWGRQNVWVPERKTWVQYADDFGERSQVGFEEGECRVQVLFDHPVTADDPAVRKELEQAVQYLVLSGTEDPVQMTRRLMKEGGDLAPAAATYTVRSGDSLWAVAKRLGVSREALADANGIDANGWLKVGQVLKVPGSVTAAGGTGGGRRMPDSKSPVVLDQVRMPDGSVVNRGNAAAFGQAVVAGASPVVTAIKGADGKDRHAVTTQFRLVPEHIRIRAEKYRPHVAEYARKNDLMPALVYAIMHTESAFNPRARSGAPAYGLMQLVPRSGARDAYLSAYGQDTMLDPDYLYDPKRNIELGAELLKILDRRYLKAIEDPFSRLYCAIAAYNTGAGNVCRAFIDGTSVKRAAGVINGLSSEAVYDRLCRDLPYQETRDYLKRVRRRMPLYAGW